MQFCTSKRFDFYFQKLLTVKNVIKIILKAIKIQNEQKSEMRERRCVKNGKIYGFRQELKNLQNPEAEEKKALQKKKEEREK